MRQVIKLKTAHPRLHQPVRKHGKLLQRFEVGFTVRRCVMSRDLQRIIALSADLGNFGNQLNQLGQKTGRGKALELGVQAEIQRLNNCRMFSFRAMPQGYTQLTKGLQTSSFIGRTDIRLA